MYSKIVNPETGKKISINGKTGKLIIKNYLTYSTEREQRLPNKILHGGRRAALTHHVEAPLPPAPVTRAQRTAYPGILRAQAGRWGTKIHNDKNEWCAGNAPNAGGAGHLNDWIYFQNNACKYIFNEMYAIVDSTPDPITENHITLFNDKVIEWRRAMQSYKLCGRLRTKEVTDANWFDAPGNRWRDWGRYPEHVNQGTRMTRFGTNCDNMAIAIDKLRSILLTKFACRGWNQFVRCIVKVQPTHNAKRAFDMQNMHSRGEESRVWAEATTPPPAPDQAQAYTDYKRWEVVPMRGVGVGGVGGENFIRPEYGRWDNNGNWMCAKTDRAGICDVNLIMLYNRIFPANNQPVNGSPPEERGEYSRQRLAEWRGRAGSTTEMRPPENVILALGNLLTARLTMNAALDRFNAITTDVATQTADDLRLAYNPLGGIGPLPEVSVGNARTDTGEERFRYHRDTILPAETELIESVDEYNDRMQVGFNWPPARIIWGPSLNDATQIIEDLDWYAELLPRLMHNDNREQLDAAYATNNRATIHAAMANGGKPSIRLMGHILTPQVNIYNPPGEFPAFTGSIGWNEH